MLAQHPPITYYPPPDAAVEQFVHDASLRLAAVSGDPGYLDPEVTWGLAEFIKLIGRIKARQLNKAQSRAFDSPSE